jgi:hypothetical protein
MKPAPIWGGLAVVLGSWLFGAVQADAGIILESATLGPTGQNGGISVGNEQYLAARFQVGTAVTVDHIGGHLAEFHPGGLFGAIVQLSGPAALPSFLPSAIASNALASTVFTAPSSSADILVPLSVTLAPGDYALVFGSGAFGASGDGVMAEGNTDTAQASYIAADLNNNTWNDAGSHQTTRFVVTGQSIVPGPAAIIPAGTATMTGLGLAWRRRRGKRD